MKKILVIMIVLLTGFNLFAAGSKEGKMEEVKSYAMGGSTTVEPILRGAIEAFEAANPSYRLSYEAQGSSVGVQGAIDGIYVLGGASRELKSSESDAGAVALPIALDGIAVVVNKNVLLDSLSRKQVAQIYAGEIKNWKEVGGADKPIIVINRDEASGTRVAFHELVMVPEMGKSVEFYKDTVVVESNGDMVTKTGATPDSIGFCGFGYISKAISAGAKTLLVDGKEPTVPNVLSGTYPVSRKLNMIHKGPIAAGSFEDLFMQYLLGKDGQAIVEEEGFIAIPN